MKGYLVGYFDSWAYDCNSVIIGYHTTFKRAVDAAKNSEYDNLTIHSGLRKLYIVEIEVNKEYTVDWNKGDWINNYPHHIIKTINGITTIKGNKTAITFDLQIPKDIPKEAEWQTVKRKNAR